MNTVNQGMEYVKSKARTCSSRIIVRRNSAEEVSVAVPERGVNKASRWAMLIVVDTIW